MVVSVCTSGLHSGGTRVLRGGDGEGMDSKRESYSQLDRLEWRINEVEKRAIATQTILSHIQSDHLVRYDQQIDRSASVMERIVWALRFTAIAFLLGIFL